ncbi:uncharacterized protein [Phyllobates terribilis]|uniref:uncharacterized protein n=1 Tax=Phyllobates terribilis TaxID=111132 RepID=UPI003CCB27B1
MPGLAQRNDQSRNATSSCCSLSSGNGSVSVNGFWSRHGDDISYNQLQKFWSELSSQARQKLLRIDKQTLFEQARKNMYCSRCNGLLLEGFMQIVMYGKSLQQEHKLSVSKDERNSEDLVSHDEVQDPSVHPWGGLTTTRDAALTLLNCYLYSKSLKGLQNVFDSGRARERERELLYPDACGGSGRGWISQGIMSYGRGHGNRETCALHTARLSCDTLVDFWSALGEETRLSLLRMKEEDFIERLMYRYTHMEAYPNLITLLYLTEFDSKRFCRDCRRNVIREFKELKELKRMRREPRCTTWFCVADTAFQYEVSNNTIRADWHQTFTDSAGTYHHFEWAVGTGEGKCDILEYENVGMNGSVQVNGVDLSGLNACYITLRAWKQDGRCTEFCVKAHALKGEHCVHGRLIVGDGYVTISRGESIRSFFEHAEEAEEEEDDSSVDKDGNELDSECSRPQKHAKSPELAREFLLDAATVIFKEQVEKAFREGTARQNAHSIFVCLALKLLEERVHVACKEIITLEKQTKLLEEEEKEKREEEERKERKRNKEREKKLRRKERLRGKKSVESNETSDISDVSSPCITEDIVSDSAEPTAASPEIQENNTREENNLFAAEESEFSTPKLKHQSGFQLDSSKRWSDRHPRSDSRYCNAQSRSNTKFSSRNGGPRFNHPSHCTCNSLHSCGCNNKMNPSRSNKANPSRSKTNNSFTREKKVWEPVKAQDLEVKKSGCETFSLVVKKNLPVVEEVISCSSSDNCSSCLSEGDINNTTNPKLPIQDSSSLSDSDSEEKVQYKYIDDAAIKPVTNQQPQIQQSIHYPAFQPPQMVDFYHPANQFVHYPHPNPYLFPSPFGYSMQYGAVQHLPSPLLYQPVLHSSNGYSAKPLMNPLNEVKREVQRKDENGDSGFSLFKFVGPVPRKAMDDGERSPELSVDCDRDCGEKDAIMEEYNLFAASKGIEFSIF